jgi:DNA-binding winged helix-turn-helix (wHTH) protein
MEMTWDEWKALKKALRRKLGASCIETVYKLGYRLKRA